MKYKAWKMGRAWQDRKAPIFWNVDIVCGGTRIARVSGVGKGEAVQNCMRIIEGERFLRYVETKIRRENSSRG